jgi:hypothetical protein
MDELRSVFFSTHPFALVAQCSQQTIQEQNMKKQHGGGKRRTTATNSGPKRQVIHPEGTGLTVVNHITFQFVCEMEKATLQAPTNGADNEWEIWAAEHHSSAF